MRSAGLDLDVVIDDDAWSAAIGDVETVCRRAAAAAYAAAAVKPMRAEACILLAGDDRVRALNREFRKLDQPTNVLAFAAADGDTPTPPTAGEPAPLGDIAIAFGVAADEAARDGPPLAHHLSHLVVHGILHLLGYDHLEDDDAVVMEALEASALAAIGVDDPYRLRDG